MESVNTDISQQYDEAMLIQMAIDTLRKPSAFRSKADVNFIMSAVKDIKFFEQLAQESGFEVIRGLCKVMSHQNGYPKSIVFSVGTIGNTFYIILRGSVSVVITEYKSGTPEQREVAVLQAGQHFGELALLFDAPRTASIVCKEDCDFGIIKRTDYKEILSKLEMRKVQNKIDFMHALPMFQRHTRRNISTLIYHFEATKVQRGDILFKEGDEPEFVYIVKKGEIRINKEFQAPEIFNFEVPKTFDRTKQPKKKVDLVILGEGEMFGDEEVVNNTRREGTAYCNSLHAEIFKITKADFEKRILNSEETALPVQFYSQSKSKWRENRLEEITVTGNMTRDFFYGSPERSGSPRRNTRTETRGSKHSLDKKIKNISPLFERIHEKQNSPFITEQSFMMTEESRHGYKLQTENPSHFFTKTEKFERRAVTPLAKPNFGKTSPAFNRVVKTKKTIGVQDYKKMIEPKKPATQPAVKELFRSRVFEKISHKSKTPEPAPSKLLLFSKDSKKPKPPLEKDSKSIVVDVNKKYITTNPVERKVKIEDQRISQIEAKEKLLNEVVKGELNCRFFDFAELLRGSKLRPSTALPQTDLSQSQLPVQMEQQHTIIERVLQTNEHLREKQRPQTPQPEEKFVNIHMRNFREKSLLKTKPRFLSPRKNVRRPVESHSGDLSRDVYNNSPHGNGNMHIRALNTSVL
jgi:CRP-like cAMP-binding protein